MNDAHSSLKRGILVPALLALASCGDATGPDSRPTFSALIDGDPFVAESASVEFLGGAVHIEADDERFRGIGFDFFAEGTGTFTPYRAEVTHGWDSWLSYEDVGSRSVSLSLGQAGQPRAPTSPRCHRRVPGPNRRCVRRWVAQRSASCVSVILVSTLFALGLPLVLL